MYHLSRASKMSSQFKSLPLWCRIVFGHFVLDGVWKRRILTGIVCYVLRTPITNIDHLTMKLPDHRAPNVQWILDCYNAETAFLPPDAANEVGGEGC